MPVFPLMRQTDVQSIHHMQMPRWLFSDPRCADMSLKALKKLGFVRQRQLHVLTQERFRQADLQITRACMDAMLRQMRMGTAAGTRFYG